MFSKTELEIMARLLEMASNEFTNHGCNDFTLAATPESIALVKRAEYEEGGNAEPYVREGNVNTQDWVLMEYLKRRCLEESAKLA